MKLNFKGEFYGLNEYIKSINSNRYKGADVKNAETHRVCWECKEQRAKPIEKYPVVLKFTWYSKNLKKDVDNVAFAKKFILDGLVMAKVLEDDSRKYVNGLADEFFVDKEFPRVEVEII